jgi:hypothetical protein
MHPSARTTLVTNCGRPITLQLMESIPLSMQQQIKIDQYMLRVAVSQPENQWSVIQQKDPTGTINKSNKRLIHHLERESQCRRPCEYNGHTAQENLCVKKRNGEYKIECECTSDHTLILVKQEHTQNARKKVLRNRCNVIATVILE